MRSKQAKRVMLVCVMIFIDILIKIIIDNFFMNKKVLITDWIGFSPFLNAKQLSIFNHELGLDLELKYLNIINVVGILVLLLLRNKLKKEKEWNTGLDIGTLMMLAGAYCSLIDKIFWRGSLDYILIFSQIVDLKDIYLFAGAAIYIGDACWLMSQNIKKYIKGKRSSRL